jgi:cytochrome b
MPVWDPVVRIAHWILAACIVAAWFTRGATHDGLGHGALAVVALRLLWGWIGPRHARFREFVRSPAPTMAYARAVAHGVEPRYLGHNPLGAWMIVALLATVALVAASGWLSSTDRFWGVEWLQQTHHFLADALLLLAALHVAGVAYTSWRHRENLLRAMITGRKAPPRPGDVLE